MMGSSGVPSPSSLLANGSSGFQGEPLCMSTVRRPSSQDERGGVLFGGETDGLRPSASNQRGQDLVPSTVVPPPISL